ncbi:MAG TPA: DUF2118 domain-containing protein, partial [Kiloniellaceae bacterium]|nr:DUF2118 domain-containing protein [Kiloniellaceae bacterium]
VDDQKLGARIVNLGDSVSVFFGNGYHFGLADPLERGAGPAHSTDLIEAPMPGLVKDVLVRAGDRVAAGDRLAVLEAMKMEHTLRAARDGTIAEVLAAAGGQR